MVDFDNETTVTRPFDEVVKIIILQRRFEAINELEEYYNKRFNHIQVTNSKVKSKIVSLYYEIKPSMDRKKPDGYDDFVKKVETIDSTDSPKELAELLSYLSKFLDSSGLLKIDTIVKFDRTNVLESNRRRMV
jgi:hypothetical protein